MRVYLERFGFRRGNQNREHKSGPRCLLTGSVANAHACPCFCCVACSNRTRADVKALTSLTPSPFLKVHLKLSGEQVNMLTCVAWRFKKFECEHFSQLGRSLWRLSRFPSAPSVKLLKNRQATQAMNMSTVDK